MRILTVTSIFPNAAHPVQGVFVLQRLHALAELGAEIRVVAPVPYVPPGPVPERYARLRAIPAEEVQGDLPVRHPRYLMVPKVGMYWQDRAYARSLVPVLREEAERFRPHVLDVHYLYPDVCGVARAAAGLGIPIACSARGSDVKLLARIPFVARRIRAALREAAAVSAVSADLAATLRGLRLYGDAVRVLPNGVDPELFFPRDRAEARQRLGLRARGRLAVCLGHVAEVHGQGLLLEALAHTEAPLDATVHFVGGGAGLDALRRRAADLGLGDRVRFAGPVPHEEVPLWFAAADVSVHPGAWAGCPNAVLESLACGTPCLASDLPEMREAVGEGGLLVAREPAAFARGLRRVLATTGFTPPPPRTWRHAGEEVLGWLTEAAGHPACPAPSR